MLYRNEECRIHVAQRSTIKSMQCRFARFTDFRRCDSEKRWQATSAYQLPKASYPIDRLWMMHYKESSKISTKNLQLKLQQMSRPTFFRLTACTSMQYGMKPIFFCARHALKRYRKAITRIIKNRVTMASRKMRLGKLPSSRKKAHLANEVSLKESCWSGATQSPFFFTSSVNV